MTLALLAGFGLALGACGGGGGSSAPDYTLSDAQMGLSVPAGTHTISGDLADAFDDPAAGMYLGQDFPTGTIITAGGLDFACTMGPCSVTVAPDGSHVTTTGTIEVVMAGGDFPTAMRPDPEPDPAIAQREAMNSAISSARAAVGAVNDDSTNEEVTAAEDAITAANDAIAAATDVPASETNAASTTVGDLQTSLDNAKRSRMAAMDLDSQLDEARTAAADAATEAMTAAGNAKTAADDADAARENAATLQTGQMSGDLAMKAREQADAAQAAYEDAQDASEAAAAATTIAAAVAARSDAEDARDAAQDAETMAGDYAQKSMDAAGMELMIVGTMKSVGDTTIDATAPNQVITTIIDGDSTTADTGFQMNLQEEMTGAVTSQDFAAGDPTATPPTADTPYRHAVTARDITIGKTVDSADDTARLAIITSYVGTKTVKVYAYAEANPASNITTNARTGTMAGRLTVANNSSAEAVTAGTHVNNTSLRAVGTFYLAGDDNTTDLANTAAVGTDSKATTVYAYTDFGADRERGGDDDTTAHLVLDSQRTEGSTTTYVYRQVDIEVAASRPDGPDDDTTADAGQVSANIPDATEYDHIHFGVWASLNAAGTDASGIGIGFVQNIDDSATEASDMPNHGSATYDGNWVATVQAIDEQGNGAVMLDDGVAMMTADFEKDTVEAVLTGLATLSGTIDGNTFGGSGLSDITHGSLSSDEDDFTGSMSGGFFGPRAAEAGGVFSFTSEDNEDGAFSGAFGGTR